jgi:hypothetical protein
LCDDTFSIALVFYDSLSEYISRFTVGICQYKKLDFTPYRNPFRAYECSSQMEPSVVQNCTLDDDTLNLVHMADNREAFVVPDSSLLNGTQKASMAHLIEFTRLNTWKSRVETFSIPLQEINCK